MLTTLMRLAQEEGEQGAIREAVRGRGALLSSSLDLLFRGRERIGWEGSLMTTEIGTVRAAGEEEGAVTLTKETHSKITKGPKA